jgi:ABC-2 type transport system permease protein
MLLSLLVSFSARFLINLASFWVPNAQGIGRLFFGTAYVLSGLVMPLRFFPAWFQTICNLTPFPATLNTVMEVYLGLLPGPALWQALAVQAAWFVGLVIAGQLILRAGIRTLVIQGG